MKIAMLLDNNFINDKRVYSEAKSLVENGYDVTIICKNEPDLSLSQEQVLNGIKIRRIFKYYLGTTVLIDKYLYAHFDLLNNLNESFEAYHCHDPETWPIGYILAQRDNAKFICDSHEFFPDYICREWHTEQLKYEITKMLVMARGNYIKFADKVITVNELIANKLKETYQLKDDPVVIYNTRSMAHYKFSSNELRDKYHIPEKIKIIVTQGNIEPSRGIDIAIKSMQFLKDTILVVAGGDRGHYIDELKKLAQELGVIEKVIFTGFVPSDKLFEYSYNADLLIFFGKPSTLSLEYSMPNKIFDYIFAEKPIIVGDLEYLKYFVQKNQIGEVVDIHNINIERISLSINNLLTNQGLREKYIQNMRRIKELYSWEEQEKKLIKLYEEISL